MRSIIVFSLVFILFSIGAAFAAEPIPYNTFVSITENAMDALDEVAEVWSLPESTEIDRTRVLNRFDAAIKQYNRYVNDWPKDSKQGEIVKSMTVARGTYQVSASHYLSQSRKTYLPMAEDQIQRALDLYMAYKRHETQKSSKKTIK
jgi:hypothetical protein